MVCRMGTQNLLQASFFFSSRFLFLARSRKDLVMESEDLPAESDLGNASGWRPPSSWGISSSVNSSMCSTLAYNIDKYSMAEIVTLLRIPGRRKADNTLTSDENLFPPRKKVGCKSK